MSTMPSAALALGTSRVLADAHDVGLFDLDGVLYVGADAVPGAVEAVREAAERGLRPAYVTNNAARTPEVVAAHLVELGYPAVAADVVTSAQAAARVVADLVPPGSDVLVVGGDGLISALMERGLQPVVEFGPDVRAVVQGFSPDIGWARLSEGVYAVAAGLPWVASNLDATVPTRRGRAPGNGALVDLVAGVAGRRPDAVAGKPEPPLHQETVERTGARHPLVVGDRLDTDIEGASRAGVPSLLVLTGVASAVDLLGVAFEHRPTYVARDLRTGLLAAHTGVGGEPGAWTCAAWTVHVDGEPGSENVTLTGGGDAVDGLRALAVASWSVQDSQQTKAAAHQPPWAAREQWLAALTAIGW